MDKMQNMIKVISVDKIASQKFKIASNKKPAYTIEDFICVLTQTLGAIKIHN
jgi:hypothetical protein